MVFVCMTFLVGACVVYCGPIHTCPNSDAGMVLGRLCEGHLKPECAL